MYIFNPIFYYMSPVFIEKVFPSIGTQQKKIIFIASVVFNILIACYLMNRFCFRNQLEDATDIGFELRDTLAVCTQRIEVSISSDFLLEHLNMWNREKIKQYHKRIATHSNRQSLFMWSRWSDANVMPSMEGLAQLSGYLVKRHAFQKDSLTVCATLAEFKDQLNMIQASQGDFRKAFIVPTHSSSWGQKENGIVAKRSEECAQHIIAVVVEREGNKLHIALLDPMIRVKNEIITPSNIGLDLEANIPFTEQELVLSYILGSNLEAESTTLYHSKVLRETSNGCWAFALKDAVAFLKLPSFFKDIKVEDAKVSKIIKEFVLKGIDILPISFMKTAQFSELQFETYFSQYPDEDSQDIRTKITKHQVEGLNQRIGHATVKWMEQLCLSSVD